MHWHHRTAIALTVLLAAGCGLAGSAAADTATPTPTISATVTPTFTITPTSTITPTPIVIEVVHLDHNRFNPLTGQSVQVLGLRPDHGAVTVRVFDLAGTRIREVQRDAAAGAAPPAWDGKNEQGQVVASGVYLVVVTGNKLHKRMRIAVLK